MPDDDDLTAQDLTIRDELLPVARAHGCDCEPDIQVIRAFPNLVAVRLLHDSRCTGFLRDRGAKGNN